MPAPVAVFLKSVSTAMPGKFSVDFEPLGRRGESQPGQTLLEAAHAAGVALASVCGGMGTCEECRIKVLSGEVTAPTALEQGAISETDLASGFRLACQVEPCTDVKLYLPPESLTSSQRLQVEGLETSLIVDPLPVDGGHYGLAVDIGTTKLAAYLVDRHSGRTVASAGAMNPQIAYGEDVVSRIAYAEREPDGALRLQNSLAEAINKLLLEMCLLGNVSKEDVLTSVLVGNTAMHHIFAGLPVAQLGHAPFAPASTSPLTMAANDLGLSLGYHATVYLPPVIAGYIGSDHLAVLIALGLDESNGRFFDLFGGNGHVEPHNLPAVQDKKIIVLDIGTNTEISLLSGGRITCCSCASGPAFEGAHIHEGMRAAPGAIERARWSEGRILWQTIDNLPPIGICGSGILDVVASLLEGDQLQPSGAMKGDVAHGKLPGYILVPADRSGLNRDLLVTRRDIHEIQLAKAAIRAGIESLLLHSRITHSDLDLFIVAGAFGTYLDIKSAVRVGMFPNLPQEKFKQVGNAAGVGARQILVSARRRGDAETMAHQLGYLELATNKDFMNLYIRHLGF